jgi:GH15 family glucan-1,4-alpha-glucosidase
MRVFHRVIPAISFIITFLSAPAHAQVPMRSFERLVTGNGWAVASYDRATRRIDTFLEHPYRFAEPRNDPPDLCFEADESRDLAYDLYFGARVDGSGSWLSEAPLDDAGYEPGTNIIRATQHLGGSREVEATTWAYMPTEIEQPVLVMVARFRNATSAAVEVVPHALFNFHLGDASGGREPSAEGEEASWDGARTTLYEYGPSRGTIAYSALTPVVRVSTALGAASAYERLRAGADIDDSRGTSGPVSDLAPGFAGAPVTLASGESVWMAASVLWALDEDAGPDVDALRTWVAGRSPQELLNAERAAWDAWHTDAPAGLTDEQRDLWLQSAAILRMGQVRETGPGFGQILASLPPGLGFVDAQWNISWVRDMAYAVAGLARSGHLDEAKAALEFQLNAPQGRHTAEVGMPYRISVTRYFGNGEEESDCNADGPNIEFDGFGLFLWSLGEYLRAGGDASIVDDHWAVISTEIADVLVSLVDESGVISADSSIWEVHWNGRQRRFTYTSLAAVRGLCEAAELAAGRGDDEAATTYQETAESIRAALIERHIDPRGAFVQSAEDLIAGHNYVDAATVEAINWGIVDPAGQVAQSTLTSLLDNLTVETGTGLMRNDDGGWYDSQEWVFVDFRLMPALGAAGRVERRDRIREWVEGQALENDLMFSELHDARSGAYAGSIPMVGFGAGAYLVALSGEGVAEAACGSYAVEPFDPPMRDGGADDAGTVEDGGTDDDGGVSSCEAGLTTADGGCVDPPVGDSGCACSSSLSARDGWSPLAVFALWFLRRRRP